MAAGVGMFIVALAVFTAVERRSAPSASATRPTIADAPPGASTDQRIAALQRQIRARARRAPYAALGSAYLQKVRETGDASFYTRADGALRRALAQDPRDLDAVIAKGTLALARHDFRAGLAWGRRAQSLAPQAAAPLPVIVDGLVELGRYRKAARALQDLLDRKPGLPAYARASYFRELHGDLGGAVEAMRLAVSAGGATPEGAAYVQTLLGTLEFHRGRLPAARAAYRTALRAQPGYPAAQAGLARADASSGRLRRAARTLRQVIDRLPLPEYIVALGEIEQAAGHRRQAHQDLALIGAERRLLAANGVNTDVEFALFAADHGDRAQAVRLGRQAYATAPSVRSADALGWALNRAGRPRAGLRYAREALRLGSVDPLSLTHAGLTARAAGEPVLARRWLTRALSGNPRFSPLWAPRARRALVGLR